MSHISYSELKEWTTCAWKHKLNYIDKIKQFKGNEHTAFGSALHTVCEIIVHDNDQNKKSEDLEQTFEKEFLQNLQKVKASTAEIEFSADHLYCLLLKNILVNLKWYRLKKKYIKVLKIKTLIKILKDLLI